MNKNIAPANAERFVYHGHYGRIGTKPSAFVSGKTVDDPATSYTLCPACQTKLKFLTHGQHQKCKCGLRMQVFGNALSIWKSTK